MKITQVDNLDNNEYHNSEKYSEYWSSSNIKKYMETPREAKFQKDNPKPLTGEGVILGTWIHDLLASKHIKGQSFPHNIFEPPLNGKGKPFGIETQAYANATTGIINPIPSNKMELINDIWVFIKQSKYSWYFEKEILGKGIAEPSFFVDGLHKYKYRPDVNTPKYIFDYKRIDKRRWTRKGIDYQIKDFGYHISAAMYQYFEWVRTGIWKPFIIIWLMTDPPFDILVQSMGQYAYDVFGDNKVIANSGAIIFEALKNQHELCQVSNQWPGLAAQFDNVGGIRMADFPPTYDDYFESFEIDNKR